MRLAMFSSRTVIWTPYCRYRTNSVSYLDPDWIQTQLGTISKWFQNSIHMGIRI